MTSFRVYELVKNVNELDITPRFERAFRRLTRKNPSLQKQIENTLHRMSENLDDPRLKTHHLSGQLAGLHACSVAYDCRVVFSKQKNPQTGNEVLLLINIGSHEEVY
jgi:mRNA interferase YafQ